MNTIEDCVIIDFANANLFSVQAIRDYIESLIAQVPPEYQAGAYVYVTPYGTYLEWQRPEALEANLAIDTDGQIRKHKRSRKPPSALSRDHAALKTQTLMTASNPAANAAAPFVPSFITVRFGGKR